LLDAQARKQSAALANRIVELAAKETNPDSLRTLSTAFVALAGKLPAAQARKQSAALANRIVEVAAKTTLSAFLHTLSEALASLTSTLPAEQVGKHATTLANRIIELAYMRTDPNSLRTLSVAFTSLPGNRKESQVSALVLRLVHMSHRDRTSESGLGRLDRLLPRLGSQPILDSLKHPSCVGSTRKAILKHFSRRFKRSFVDVWELIQYLKEHEPNLDVASPLTSGRSVPRATQRARRYAGDGLPEPDGVVGDD
jgi:hypothetical protein